MTKIVALRDSIRPEGITGDILDIGFIQGNIIEKNLAVPDFHSIAGHTDNALKTHCFCGAIGGWSDDDIAALRLSEIVDRLNHDQTLAVIQFRLHAAAVHDAALNGGLQHEEKGERHPQCNYQFSNKSFH